MTIRNYLQIQDNEVTNVVVWDGNVNTWQPPEGSIMLVQDETPAMMWMQDTSVSPAVYRLTEQMGLAGVGFTWDGTVCITNEPEPTPVEPKEDQPLANGVTTI